MAMAKGMREEAASEATARIVHGVQRGQIPVHLRHGSELVGAESHGFLLADGHTVVQIPIRGPNIVSPSNLSIFTDRKSRIIKVIEVQYSPDLERLDRGRVTRWDDGPLALDKVVTAAGEVLSPADPAAARSDTQVIQRVWSWKKFNDCLASHGIAAWLIAASEPHAV